MKSKVGSILTLISAILNFIGAFIVLIIAIGVAVLGVPAYEVSSGEAIAITVIIFIFALILFVLGYLLLRASKKMKVASTTKNGAIWAIVIGVITIGNISGILALIGGIIALVDANK